MSASLDVSQLKSALTAEQLSAARAKGISPGDTDPVYEEICAALAKVDTFAAGWDVLPGMLTGWARDLACHQIAKRLGVVTEDQVRAYERANKELEDLRDGKFRNIPRVSTSTQVLSGSRPKVI